MAKSLIMGKEIYMRAVMKNRKSLNSGLTLIPPETCKTRHQGEQVSTLYIMVAWSHVVRTVQCSRVGGRLATPFAPN